MAWQNFSRNVASLGSNVAGSITSGVQSIDLSAASNKISNQLSSIQQQVREAYGKDDDITELPEDYKILEARVDALRDAHANMLKVAKVYSTESYDYPTQINESLGEFSNTAAHTLSTWVATATKGTKLPQPAVVEKAPAQHKTLPHALSRAATNSSIQLTGDTQVADAGQPNRLGQALQAFAVAQDQIGSDRIAQDAAIATYFVKPWQNTLTNSINAAMRSRQNVKAARLHLDTCRGKFKSATSTQKQEQARLEVEAAEEKLVTETEQAINLMQAVLDNPEPLQGLLAFVKAQQKFYASAAETLAGCVSDFEDAADAAEAAYRKSRV